MIRIDYHVHDEYTGIAEKIVGQFEQFLKERGIIHGCLGFSDELEMLIAQNLREEYNAIDKKTDDDNNKTEHTQTSTE